jgi:chromosome segregation ATPase
MDIELKIAILSLVIIVAGLNLSALYRSFRDRGQLPMIQGALQTIRQSQAAHVKSTADRFSQAHQERSQLDHRLRAVETRMGKLPTHQDLADIREQLVDVREGVAALHERTEATLAAVHSIQTHLMEAKR